MSDQGPWVTKTILELEERDGGNLLAFRAGHKAGIETYRWRSSSKCGWRNSPWLT